MTRPAQICKRSLIFDYAANTFVRHNHHTSPHIVQTPLSPNRILSPMAPTFEWWRRNLVAPSLLPVDE